MSIIVDRKIKGLVEPRHDLSQIGEAARQIIYFVPWPAILAGYRKIEPRQIASPVIRAVVHEMQEAGFEATSLDRCNDIRIALAIGFLAEQPVRRERALADVGSIIFRQLVIGAILDFFDKLAVKSPKRSGIEPGIRNEPLRPGQIEEGLYDVRKLDLDAEISEQLETYKWYIEQERRRSAFASSVL